METTKPTPAEELRAEALSRTFAAVRAAFVGITDAEADEVAALLLRSADGRTSKRFRRAGGAARTAEFSLMQHRSGAEAFYVSRIV